MMLYSRKDEKTLDTELFRNPPSIYRGAPFWAWNCRLDRETLLEQIGYFKQMGFGGFHIHARTGLDTVYLGDQFMEFVKLCDRKAISEGMLCWLYDEDRFPSGFAGGIVTKDVRFRARHLLFSRNSYEKYAVSKEEFDRLVAEGAKPEGCYFASYCVELENGCLKQYQRIEKDQKPEKGKIWHAYLALANEDPYFNNQTYLDDLNPKAVQRFIDVTYQRYYDVVGPEFGKSIPAIFTDEPQVSCKSTMAYAESESDVTASFTDDLPETYKNLYGVSLLDVLPEIFWELPDGKVSAHRYRYHNHLAERFACAYMDSIAKWCGEHNIYATGHYMSERTLYSQTLALGDAMRLYRRYQLPGIDILCDAKEFTTAKQAASVSRQYGREGVISEMYGVTHWYHDFKGHKLQGDWQAALGVTVRVPHLAWMTMAGEGKRDWPASIGYQSPWFKEYPLIENHFSRLNTVLARGHAVVRVGVIHPIESFWLMFGPNDQTGGARDEYDARFENFIKWMLYGLIDFDYISESLLPELETPDAFMVGKMRYEAIVVPDCRTLRGTTLEHLKRFRAAGGRVIFAGGVPMLKDAVPSEEIKSFAKECEQIPFDRTSLLKALEPQRDVDVRLMSGRIADNLIYQMREDNGVLWLFLCHVNRKRNKVDEPERCRIRIKGEYNPLIYDTMTGDIKSCEAETVNGETAVTAVMYAEDSLLLRLAPGTPETKPAKAEPKLKEIMRLHDPVNFNLEEPNVLLLDRAEYAFDDGQWYAGEDILRIDNRFRKQLGWTLRCEHTVQPYLLPDEDAEKHILSLRYTVESEIENDGLKLAMEQPELAAISVNGQPVDSAPDGWFADKLIKTIPIPALNKGRNEIVLRMRFKPKTNIESCYILGKFGVRVYGAHTCIVKAPQKLAFGDIVTQGLPFYAGNVVYRCGFSVKTEIKNAILEVPHFASPVLEVYLDGKKSGPIAFAPHRTAMGSIGPGGHTLEIISFGNRYNTFGTLHNANDEFKWYGPDSFRTTGSQWTDTYLLRQTGILDRPIIYSEEQ